MKVDRNKLLKTEFPIIEFDPNTFQVRFGSRMPIRFLWICCAQVLLDYLHSGCCPLSCVTIPGFLSHENTKRLYFQIFCNAFPRRRIIYIFLRADLRRRTLRPARSDPSVLSPRQTIHKDRDCLPGDQRVSWEKIKGVFSIPLFEKCITWSNNSWGNVYLSNIQFLN